MIQVTTPPIIQDTADSEMSAALDLLAPPDWDAETSSLLDNAPTLAPSPVPATDQAALGDILADALFGEVIEISDLIPHLLAPGVEAAPGPVDVVVGAEMAGDAMAAMVPFTILFEEDGSSGHGTF